MVKTILDIVVNLIGSSLSKVICSACDAVKSFFEYKKADIQSKAEERHQQKEQDFSEKVDKVTQDGTIEDLLDLKR